MRIFLIILCLFSAIPVNAQSFIRDAESENYLRDISEPIFEAAGLTPDHVDIFILGDSSINAFVAGGQNVFVHTGLIQKAENTDVLAGVMAHEVGHIRAGHLVQKGDQVEKTLLQTAVGTVLGLAGGFLAGSPEAGIAILSGSQHVATRDFLAHSRGLEASADQAALELLDEVETSPKGLLSLMKLLGAEQRLQFGKLDPYALTHPATPERARHIRAHLQQHPEKDYAVDAETQHRHEMVVAKLNGFLGRAPDVVKRLQAKEDAKLTDPERYELAIGLYRLPDLEGALAQLDVLLAQAPENAYLHELKGQMLFENGRIRESIAAYKRAEEIQAHPLFSLGLGLAHIALEEHEGEPALADAIKHLKVTTIGEPQNAYAWRQLGVAYGRDGQLGESYVALAESSLLAREHAAVTRFLKQAEPHINDNPRLRLRVADLQNALEKQQATAKK